MWVDFSAGRLELTSKMADGVFMAVWIATVTQHLDLFPKFGFSGGKRTRPPEPFPNAALHEAAEEVPPPAPPKEKAARLKASA